MELSNLILEVGIPRQTLLFLYSLPIIATLATISRNVVGLKGFRLFYPIITTYAFIGLGIRYSLAISAIVVIGSFLTRLIMKKSRLQYSSRMVLVLTTLGFSILLALFVASKLGIDNVANRPVFPMLLIIALGEEFIETLIKQGPKNAFVLYIETIVLSVVGYFLLISSTYQEFILEWPVVILLAILIVIGIGRWTGLRLTELLKFRNVIEAESKKEE